MKTVLLSLTLAAIASTQPALSPPQVGFLQDSANSLRPVFGIAGNFLMGDSTASDVVAAAFSGSFGILKTDSALIVTDRQGQRIATQDAPAGQALFAFSREGSPALAYFPDSNLLLAWNGGSFQLTYFDWSAFPAAAVRAIASSDLSHASFIVQRDDGLWDLQVLLATGQLDSQAALPGVKAPVLMPATGELVYSDAQGIVVRRLDGSEVHVNAQLPASFSLRQMGDGWVEIQDLDGCAQFAARITAGQEGFYRLPEVEQ
ncbi:MAG: hypothetical protein LAP38_27100 [Acidobacteriia bacterium]|nr:hypothetical protein [Terriglobia bacterium]